MKNLIPFILSLSGASLLGGRRVFDIKDPKNVNNVIFQMDAPLESIRIPLWAG